MADRASHRDALLEYLRRKGCAVGRARIVEDLRWPPQEIDAALTLLMRSHQVRAPRPGEYEAMPLPLPGHEPASDPRGTGSLILAMCTKSEQPAPPPAITQETPMAKAKTCTKCGDKKGPTGFPKGSDVCRLCTKGGSTPKPVKTPKRVNGAPTTIKAVAEKHARNGNPFAATVEKLRSEAAKYAAAADALEALGA